MKTLIIALAFLIVPAPVSMGDRVAGASASVKTKKTAVLAGVREFTWEDMKVVMVKTARKYDIHPSVLVAMTALESARGNSYLCRTRNNCWGLGAFDNDPNQAFHFSSFQEGAEYIVRMLATDPRYSQAYAERHDPYAMIREIKAAGYASSPMYVEKITSLSEWSDYMY